MSRVAILLILVTARPTPAKDPGNGYTGKVVDASTNEPIPGALVTVQNIVVTTAGDGIFRIDTKGERIAVRAPGYRRGEIASDAFKSGTPEVKLVPFRPKALYLSVFGIGSRTLREPAVSLTNSTELNALVIDVKGDRGLIPYRSSIPLAVRAGASRSRTVNDMKQLIAELHAEGLYLIARIVVFKDDPLAMARPDLAVKTANGKIWRDREGLAWTDPAKVEAWEYNIDIAEEAARNGFDEIQFDYVRFPDAVGLTYCVPNTQDSRLDALAQFLKNARKRLTPYNVFLAADIFGYVCWNLNDTRIGQKLEALAPLVDYICPMLYPSGFQFGIPGYRMPVAHPYEMVHLSLEKARQRTGLSPVHFRPWLQAFRDYAFDHRSFGPSQIMAQIKAAGDFGSDGWMLWNPHNVYSKDGLRGRE